MQYLFLYLATIPVFVMGDLLWLGFIANNFYQSRLGHLLGEVNWVAAIVFYFVFVLGILIFAVIPGLEAHSLDKAVLWGVMFGLFTYATYDLTNHATMRDWPVLVTIVDIVWGSILSGTVAAVSFYIGKTWFL